MKCLSCSQTLEIFYSINKPVTVSSDVRPVSKSIELYKCNHCQLIQKRTNKQYLDDVSKIYESYFAQSLAQGGDELLQSGDVSYTRSELILGSVQKHIGTRKKHIDIGCGSGVFLSASVSKGLDSYAQDISSNHQKEISGLVGENRFYVGGIDVIDQKFEVVSLIHVLEHIPDFNAFFENLKSIMEKDAILIIQVPYSLENLYDLFVYDHISHFSYRSLHSLLQKYFKYINLSENAVYKEITAVVSDSPIQKAHVPEDAVFDRELLDEFMGLSDGGGEEISILGSGPSALVAAQLLDGRFSHFIDEDARKQGNTLFGKAIKADAGASKVILPYPRKQAESIASRLKNINVYYPKLERSRYERNR